MAAVTGTFNAPGTSESFDSGFKAGTFNMSLWGTFAGTVRLERSFNEGVTWLPITALGEEILFDGPCSEQFEEHERGVRYRLNCTALSSGTINYRLGG